MKKFLYSIKEMKLDIIFIIFLSIFTVILIDINMQNDTFFTINTGNYILENGINEIEPFTFHENLKFIKLRWIFDIVIAIIYNNFGFLGLYIFEVIIAIFIASILYEGLTNLYGSKLLAFVITCVVMKYLSIYISCRAQIVSYLLFALEMFFIEKLLVTQKNKYIAFLFITSVLLVNFHSSVWLVFLVPFIPIFAEKILYKFNKKFNLKILNKFDIKDLNLKKIYICFGICLLSGFISPLGLSPYTYIFKVMSGISKEFIAELLPLDFMYTEPFNYILVITILIILFSKYKINIRDVFTIFGFLLFAKLAIRNSFISIIFISYPITKIIIEFLELYNIKHCLDGIQSVLQKNLLSDIFLILFLVYHVNINYLNLVNEKFVPIYMYPVSTVDYYLENEDIENSRLYTDLDYGSYVEFRGIKPFLDSRTEVFTKEFSNVSILEDWYKAEYEDYDYIFELIEKYDITHLLLYKNNQFNEKFQTNPGKYEILNEDDNFILYKIN